MRRTDCIGGFVLRETNGMAVSIIVARRGGSALTNQETMVEVPLFRSLRRNSADAVSRFQRTLLLRRLRCSGTTSWIADDDACEFMPVSTDGNEDRFHRISLADILGDRNRCGRQYNGTTVPLFPFVECEPVGEDE